MVKAAVIMLIALPLLADSKWKVIGGKTSAVTQAAEVSVVASPAKGRDSLLLHCIAGRVEMRIFRDFNPWNGIYDSLDKSKLERATNKGEQYEVYGYQMLPNGSNYNMQVRYRFEGEASHTETTVEAGWTRGVYIAILDSLAADWLHKMANAPKLYVELPTKQGPQVSEFGLSGFASAAKQAESMGCKLRQ